MPAKPLIAARWLWVLLGVLAWGLGLRVWGIKFGLPFVYHPDEGALVMPALKILQTGDFRPTHLYYGSAYIYSLTALYIPFFLFSAWRGTLKVVAELPVFVDYIQIGQYPFPGVFLLGRLLTAILGGLTVLTTFALGRRVVRIVSGQDQNDQIAIRAGLAGAALLAVEWFHTQNAHFVTTDVPMTFILTLAAMRCIDVFQRGQWRDYLWAGFWIGLTASTKFPGGLVFVALFVAHVLRVRDWAEMLDGRLGLGVAGTAAGFFLGTPYALDLPYFLNWLATNVSFFGTTGTGLGSTVEGSTGLYYLKELFFGPSALLAVTGVLGLGWLIRKNWRLGGVLIAFPAAHAVLIASQGARFPRFLVPLMPFLAIGAGLALVVMTQWLACRLRPTVARPTAVLTAIVVLIAAYPCARLVAWDVRLTQPDVRTTALKWYNTHIPPQAKIIVDPAGPPVPRNHNVVLSWDFTTHPPDWYVQQDFEYMIITESRLRDSNLTERQAAIYREFMSRYKLVQMFKGPMLGTEDQHIWVYRVRP
jgi:hypothetical protein